MYFLVGRRQRYLSPPEFYILPASLPFRASIRARIVGRTWAISGKSSGAGKTTPISFEPWKVAQTMQHNV